MTNPETPTGEAGGTQVRRFRNVVIAAVIALAGLAVCLALSVVAVHHALRRAILRDSQVTKPETGYPFPSPDDITQMTAIDCRYPDGASFPRFDVPKDCWAEMIEALSPSQYDPRPAAWNVLGGLTIQRKEGTGCEVDLYYVGQDPRYPDVVLTGAFSAGPNLESRKYYRGGNEAKLKAAITRAYIEYKKSNSSEPNKSSHD